ncbi:hypothetical protein CORC01_04679 [Colletotrichum orchidophilum]|uniref:Uncharacterized protein n=1 Tax=Colletotrichum orchidophilum TaxID=1209926 RepID=A0A1G4BFF1_9PEZI|nr:uncharacterized protein CORC01_04679 [Colletotrichum orchidophilum]OHF00033.1 hypothetical protein CORC01_04679 [Colletotrichum orchidophilum]
MRDLFSCAKRKRKRDYYDYFVYHRQRSIFAEKPYAENKAKQEWLFLGMISGKLQLQDNITEVVYWLGRNSHTVLEDYTDRDVLARLKNTEMCNSLKFNLSFAHNAMENAVAMYTGSSKFLSAEPHLAVWAMQPDPKSSSDWSFIRLIRCVRLASRDISDDYVAYEMIDNLHSAQATVSVALTYVVHHLNQNPGWTAKARAQIEALPGEDDGLPVWQRIEKSPILEASLRKS